ncbi:MAG: ribbon-helix-helix domain-containing protein [Phaeospirillum sp.]|nr:ribbon-helix-helix domain-containing protein [Phaeospirillum sp.]
MNRKRSVMIAGHATSVTLEAAFWDELKGIAEARSTSLNHLVTEIDSGRAGNLSSAIRVFVLGELKRKAVGEPAVKKPDDPTPVS